MKNKVLIRVYVQKIDEEYELYIPVNESIKKILELIVKSVSELSDIQELNDDVHHLIDPDNSTVYNDYQIVRDTNIRNSKKVILV